MNATPNRLRLFSASLLAVAMLGACTGEFEDAQERAELAADIVEAEMPQLSVDVDALACAIELAELELSEDGPSWEPPPLGPCPPTFVTDVTMGTQTANDGSDAGELEELDPLTEMPADPSNGRGTKLEVFEPLGLAPLSLDPLVAAPLDHRDAELETVPQHPNGLDRPQLRPHTQERGATLETVPQHPNGLDRPQLRPVDAELALDITVAPPAYELQRPDIDDDELQTQACVDSCVQLYIVCAAHPDHELYACAEQLAECSAAC